MSHASNPALIRDSQSCPADISTAQLLKNRLQRMTPVRSSSRLLLARCHAPLAPLVMPTSDASRPVVDLRSPDSPPGAVTALSRAAARRTKSPTQTGRSERAADNSQAAERRSSFFKLRYSSVEASVQVAGVRRWREAAALSLKNHRPPAQTQPRAANVHWGRVCVFCSRPVNTSEAAVTVRDAHFHHTCFTCCLCNEQLPVEADSICAEADQLNNDGGWRHTHAPTDESLLSHASNTATVNGGTIDESHAPTRRLQEFSLLGSAVVSVLESRRKHHSCPLAVCRDTGQFSVESLCTSTLVTVSSNDSASPTERCAGNLCEDVNSPELFYRQHFYDKEHYNWFIREDTTQEPAVLSVRVSADSRVFLQVRLSSGTQQLETSVASLNQLCENSHVGRLSVNLLAKLVCERAGMEGWRLANGWHQSPMLDEFERKFSTRQLKFGVVYQLPGHVNEEQLLAPSCGSCHFDRFLQLLGDRIVLQGHEGFRGGLDTQHNQTGVESVYTVYEGREIMFHVTPMLPHSQTDPQQLQKKRHIGNDIVAIVFQDSATPFFPDAIVSHFLHAYIIVRLRTISSANTSICSMNTACRSDDSAIPGALQNSSSSEERIKYEVCVVTKNGVPLSKPALSSACATFTNTVQLRDFLLRKLVATEMAAYRAPKFASLQSRTRRAFLSDLCRELSNRSLLPAAAESDVAGIASHNSVGPDNPRTGSVKLISSMRKALRSRSRGSIFELKDRAVADKTVQKLHNAKTEYMDMSSRLDNSTYLGSHPKSALRDHEGIIAPSRPSLVKMNNSVVVSPSQDPTHMSADVRHIHPSGSQPDISLGRVTGASTNDKRRKSAAASSIFNHRGSSSLSSSSINTSKTASRLASVNSHNTPQILWSEESSNASDSES